MISARAALSLGMLMENTWCSSPSKLSMLVYLPFPSSNTTGDAFFPPSFSGVPLHPHTPLHPPSLLCSKSTPPLLCIPGLPASAPYSSPGQAVGGPAAQLPGSARQRPLVDRCPPPASAQPPGPGSREAGSHSHCLSSARYCVRKA